ncbi:hypothetical protein FNAPI_11527 [Fusarium napiforme]|uniref:Uncharacterized protein n=1 Tax=Fusarium napiforme TaxID=42672 RepID=A0A8H5IJH0_9HYPO|nr:hypothetical protein FNAPI_11527 [Fusarium napiforme]
MRTSFDPACEHERDQSMPARERMKTLLSFGSDDFATKFLDAGSKISLPARASCYNSFDDLHLVNLGELPTPLCAIAGDGHHGPLQDPRHLGSHRDEKSQALTDLTPLEHRGITVNVCSIRLGYLGFVLGIPLKHLIMDTTTVKRPSGQEPSFSVIHKLPTHRAPRPATASWARWHDTGDMILASQRSPEHCRDTVLFSTR